MDDKKPAKLQSRDQNHSATGRALLPAGLPDILSRNIARHRAVRPVPHEPLIFIMWPQASVRVFICKLFPCPG